MADEERDIKDDPLFQEDMSKIVKGNYLGDLEVLNQLLRFFASELITSLSSSDNRKWQLEEAKRFSKKLAFVLIGRSRSFQKMRTWNEPGGIDVFCAKWLGIDEIDPNVRMEGAAANFYSEILDVVVYSQQDGILEEQWGWQLDAVVERYAMLFLGISPAQQEVMT